MTFFFILKVQWLFEGEKNAVKLQTCLFLNPHIDTPTLHTTHALSWSTFLVLFDCILVHIFKSLDCFLFHWQNRLSYSHNHNSYVSWSRNVLHCSVEDVATGREETWIFLQGFTCLLYHLSTHPFIYFPFKHILSLLSLWGANNVIYRVRKPVTRDFKTTASGIKMTNRCL